MNNSDYKEALFYAASIFNERLGTEFSEDNLVLCCFQTENQQEVFEQFCMICRSWTARRFAACSMRGKPVCPAPS